MKTILKTVGASVLLAGLMSGVALAARNPSGTGQPGASCEVSTTAPPGFGTQGFANAENHYANGSGHNVSQYDVACYQLSN